MDKELIKKELVRLQEEHISELSEKVNTTHSMVDIDESDTIDPEDFSHQYESGELEQLMKVQLKRAKVDLARLKEVDFGPKDRVTEGAYIETNQFNFLVGFASNPFDIGDKHIVGISVDSPIYSLMKDMKQGESFSYRDLDYTIDKIF